MIIDGVKPPGSIELSAARTSPPAHPEQNLRTEVRSRNALPARASSGALNSLLEPLLKLLGLSGPDNSPYVNFQSRTRRVDTPPGGQQILKENAQWLFNESSKVIQHAEKQIESGRNPWEDLREDIGVPMSSELIHLLDNSPEQRYYHNCLVNFIAGSVLNGSTIKASEDLDGTNTDKSQVTFGTRRVLPLSVIKWNRDANNSAIRHLGTRMLVNTARSINPTVIYARNQGLEGSATYGILNSPLEELVGFSLDEQLDFAEKIEIAALNGSIVHRPGRPTYLSNKLLRADELLRYLGYEFIEEFLIKPARENEYSAVEPKGLTSYVLDTKRIIGKVYYPHYLKIVQLKEKFVDNRPEKVSLEEGWEAFRKELAENVRVGIGKWSEVARLRKELESAEAGSDVKELQEQLQKARDAALPYVLLPCKELVTDVVQYKNAGEEVGTLTYKDMSEQEVVLPEYYELLKADPKAFFEKVTEGRLNAVCFHFFNSRGTPQKGAIPQAYKTLSAFADRKDVRRKIRHLNALSTPTNPPHPHIKTFVDKAEKAFAKGPIAFIEWRLLKHMMYRYKKDELDGNQNFKCGEEVLEFSDEYKAKWERYKQENNLTDANFSELTLGYIDWVKREFDNAPGPARELAAYVEGIFSNGSVEPNNSKAETNGKQKKETEFIKSGDFIKACKNQKLEGEHAEYLFPDEMFSRNNKIAYTDDYSFYSVFTVVDKSSPLKPDADFYVELQPAREKYQAVPSRTDSARNNLTVLSSGDSLSDTGSHVAALEGNGFARVIYNLIKDEDICNEAIAQRLKYARDVVQGGERARQEAKKELHVACTTYCGYGLRIKKDVDENGNAYRGFEKVFVNEVSDDDGEKKFEVVYKVKENGKAFTRDDIIGDIKKQYRHRIDRTSTPAAKIRRWAEIIHLLTGEEIEFNDRDFELAKQANKRGVKAGPETEESRALRDYGWAVIELENCSKLSPDAPRFRVIYEYHDDATKSVYYKRKDRKLLTRGDLEEGKENYFKGDETKLRKVAIGRNNHGHFIYKKSGLRIEEPEFLDKCLIEEEFIPSVSPVSGLFAKDKLLSLIGLGNKNRGQELLKSLVIKLPKIYNKTLEWSGGLMALGGLIRIVSKATGGLKEPLYKFGYVLSNSLRAVSALAGAFRGEFNVHKYHDIFAGEVINMFSALKLPNGVKHLGLGIGNFVLFLGRSRQRAQKQQRTNSFPHEELKEKKLLLEKVVDPRPYVRDVTRFSTEETILKIKNAAIQGGLSPLLGEVVGNVASAILTPVKMIKDVLREPRLITQLKARLSEKSGKFFRSVPSAGHLLAVAGTLSGLGALAAATLGRMQHVGEVAENGFNKIGQLAISFANSIPALGIIANGKEIASDTNGLSKIFRGLDGKDVRFDPKRAGFGQVFAGIGYAVLPWFGLHKDSVAAAYDIANGLYFGLPGARMSVAEEEKPNTEELSRNILIQGDEFYKQGNA